MLINTITNVDYLLPLSSLLLLLLLIEHLIILMDIERVEGDLDTILFLLLLYLITTQGNMTYAIGNNAGHHLLQSIGTILLVRPIKERPINIYLPLSPGCAHLVLIDVIQITGDRKCCPDENPSRSIYGLTQTNLGNAISPEVVVVEEGKEEEGEGGGTGAGLLIIIMLIATSWLILMRLCFMRLMILMIIYQRDLLLLFLLRSSLKNLPLIVGTKKGFQKKSTRGMTTAISNLHRLHQ